MQLIRNLLSSAAFTAFLLVSTPSIGLETVSIKEFNQMYRDYAAKLDTEATEAELAQDALSLAQTSEALSGATHENTINLYITAANHFRNAGEYKTSAKYYDKTLADIEDSELKNTESHLFLLSEIMKSKNVANYSDRYDLSKSLYSVLDDYLDDNEESFDLYTAATALNSLIENGQVGVKLSSLDRLAKPVLERAETTLPESSDLRIQLTYNYAQVLMGRNKNKKAIKYFTRVVDTTSSADIDYTHPYEIASRARLVNLFEEQGNSTEATKHCVAIGSMSPWQDDIEPTPLFRVNPRFPANKARFGKEGWVKLRFDISPFGFVENVEAVEYSTEGFVDVTIEAVQQWRYAPKFENGQAVTAKGLEVQIDYTLGAPGEDDRNFTNTE